MAWIPLTPLAPISGAHAGLGRRARHDARAAQEFTLAVIPDAQNYLDYSHQSRAGFPFDAHALLDRQLEYVAANACGNGGDIAFVSVVGDVWQHPSLAIDPQSVARGYSAVFNPWLASVTTPTPYTRSLELPAADAAFGRLAGAVPFGVAPGNHDYDAMYSDSRWPPASDVTDLDAGDPCSIGMLHIGGLDNFRRVFGASSRFFEGLPWYVSSYRGGGDSAQLFSAGGFIFLHIALEMDAPGEALFWAMQVLDAFPGLPTIVTTHDYLDTDGRRRSDPIIDPQRTDPTHNDPQDVWDHFLSRNDQIFLVLCGHEHGEAFRVDDNIHGHPVVQILADYQDRRQVSVEQGLAEPAGLGDGWMRLLRFDMEAETPTLHARTYSTYYDAYSTELPRFAAWYKEAEAPGLSDEEFLAKGDFVVQLDGFRERFGRAAELSFALAGGE